MTVIDWLVVVAQIADGVGIGPINAHVANSLRGGHRGNEIGLGGGLNEYVHRRYERLQTVFQRVSDTVDDGLRPGLILGTQNRFFVILVGQTQGCQAQ